MKRSVSVALATILLAGAAGLAIAQPAAPARPPMPPAVMDPAQVPAGHYVTDPNHGGFILKVQHMGLDQSMFRMDKFHAELDYDPAHADAGKVKVDVDPSSFDAPTPAISAEFSKEFLGAPDHPISFVGDHLRRTGANTGVLSGQLTLNGVTKPFSLDVTFNGLRAGMGPPRIGFTAHGVVNRADFNVGPKMPLAAVGNVDLDVTMEFTKAA
jgi:polyisoprenoid-binding protein YceI